MGVNINQLEMTSVISPTDTIPVQTAGGTKQMPLTVLVPNTPAAHNNIIRGKVLTDTYTLAQIFSMIQARDYHDIFAGDRLRVTVPAIAETGWTEQVAEFLVAEIESHNNYGDTAAMCNKGHLCIVPAGILGSAKMNDTHTTEGAYEGSYMHKTVMPAVQAALETAFGADHILTTREFLSKVVDTTHASMSIPNANGCVTFANNWVDCKVRLMTEMEVYGSAAFSSSGEDLRCGLGHQLSVFRLDHTALFNRAAFWLSAVALSGNFANVDWDGGVSYNGAGYVIGVRPRFVIG